MILMELHLGRDYHLIIRWQEKLEHHRFVRYQWKKESLGVLKNDEIDYKLRDHSVFTAYAPYNNPKFAITIVAEHMGSGSKVAAPIAKRILEFSLKNYLNYV